MKDDWSDKLACATHCYRCNQKLDSKDPRILSVYDHQAICLACKKDEEKQPDYQDVSRKTIGQCMIDSEIQYGDPEGFCFHHFYPFKC